MVISFLCVFKVEVHLQVKEFKGQSMCCMSSCAKSTFHWVLNITAIQKLGTHDILLLSCFSLYHPKIQSFAQRTVIWDHQHQREQGIKVCLAGDKGMYCWDKNSCLKMSRKFHRISVVSPTCFQINASNISSQLWRQNLHIQEKWQTPQELTSIGERNHSYLGSNPRSFWEIGFWGFL